MSILLFVFFSEYFIWPSPAKMPASVSLDNDWYCFFEYSAATCCLNFCKTFSAPRLTSLSALTRAYAVKIYFY